MARSARETVARLLATADVRIDGERPWDLQVHDQRVFGRTLGSGSLGLGEAYMDGLWDCRSLDQLFEKLLEANLEHQIRRNIPALINALRFRLFNLQSRRRAFQVGQRHYDADNELFTLMLDRRMTYSCGYWREADNLDKAQEAKLHLICRKLGLKPGMRLLDIGCGWGSLVEYAAREFGVEAVGITVSREQAELARTRCEGLPVEIRLEDYRSLQGSYDRIASVGMVEHVGWRNYRRFMRIAHRCLRPGGLFLLHTIGSRVSRRGVDPWIERHIFPNGMLPSLAQLSRAAEGLFLVEDVHNFGPDYDRTLMAWEANIREARDEIRGRHGQRFYRMWRYYLLSCAAAFRVRHIQLYQLLLSSPPLRGQPPGARER